MPVIEHKFGDRAALIESLFEEFVRELEQTSPATLLLSGGSTPVPLYRRLAQADLDWGAINIALVDERWVGVDDAASNERLLRETLLVGNAAIATFVGMKNEFETPFDGQAQCNARYAGLPRPYSICLLGMGTDGHTASLFPGAEGLDAAIDSQQCCAPIRALRSPVTGAQVERMTMTPSCLLDSRRLILMISGTDKWEVFQQACRQEDSVELPIGLFIHQQRVPLEVYWAP